MTPIGTAVEPGWDVDEVPAWLAEALDLCTPVEPRPEPDPVLAEGGDPC